MLSAHFDWLARRWIATSIHVRANREKQNGFGFRFGYWGANFNNKQVFNVFNGKLFNLSKLKILCMWKSIAQQDFHFLLCAFEAGLLEINQILDLLIIQLIWYTVKQLFTSVSVKLVHIYWATSGMANIHHFYLHFNQWIIVNY